MEIIGTTLIVILVIALIVRTATAPVFGRDPFPDIEDIEDWDWASTKPLFKRRKDK